MSSVFIRPNCSIADEAHCAMSPAASPLTRAKRPAQWPARGETSVLEECDDVLSQMVRVFGPEQVLGVGTAKVFL